MTTCCECNHLVKVTEPVWREGKVVKLCSSCIQKTKPSEKIRLAKESHLEAWLKTQAPVVKKKALEEMTLEEINAEIARLLVS